MGHVQGRALGGFFHGMKPPERSSPKAPDITDLEKERKKRAVLKTRSGTDRARPRSSLSAEAKAFLPPPVGTSLWGGPGDPRIPLSFVHQGADSPLAPYQFSQAHRTSAMEPYPFTGYGGTGYHYSFYNPYDYAMDSWVPWQSQTTGARSRVSFETLGADRVSGPVRRSILPPDYLEKNSSTEDA
jgi:hypothetical protein